MRTIILEPGARQQIGRSGDTGVTVQFRALPWHQEYPAGLPYLMVTAPGGVRIPVTVTYADGLISGEVPDELLVKPGLYSYEFAWVSAGEQVQSSPCGAVVLDGETSKRWNPHCAAPDWADRIFLAAESIEQKIDGVTDAVEAAQEAQDGAETAQAGAEAAQDGAETAQGAAEAAQAAAEAVLESIPEEYTELSNDVSDLKDAADEIVANVHSVKTINLEDVGSNALYASDLEIVKGTGAYVFKDIYAYTGAIASGDIFTAIVDSVEGSTNNGRISVYADNSSGTEIRHTNTGTITITDNDISSGAVRVRFRLYPATGTAMPTGVAKYNNLTIVRGAVIEDCIINGKLKTAVEKVVAESNSLQYIDENIFGQASAVTGYKSITQGTEVTTGTAIISGISLPKLTYYKVKIEADETANANKYALYDQSVNQLLNSMLFGHEYLLQANTAITALKIYIGASDVTGTGTIKMTLTTLDATKMLQQNVAENSNRIDALYVGDELIPAVELDGFWGTNGRNTITYGATHTSVHTPQYSFASGEKARLRMALADNTKTLWLAYAKYDSSGNFIERVVIANTGSSYDGEFVMPGDASSVSFTYSRFNDGDSFIITKPSNVVLTSASPKNLILPVWYNAQYNGGTYAELTSGKNSAATKPDIAVEPGKLYTLSWGNDAVDGCTFYVHEVNANKTVVNTTSLRNTYTTPKQITILAGSTTAYVGIQIYKTDYADYMGLIPASIQFETGTEPTIRASVGQKTITAEYIDEKELYQRISTDGLLRSPLPELPPYYYENGYINGKVDTINGLMKECMGNGDAFVFITDEHWPYNQKISPALIGYINHMCSIPMLVSGGDTADYASAEFCQQLRNHYNRPIFHVSGNHDWFYPTDGNDLAAMMDGAESHRCSGNPYERYYYFDNTFKKIRYIVLNAYVNDSAQTSQYKVISGYNAAQLAWLQNDALNTPDNSWDIIVFTHWIGPNSTTSITGYADFVTALEGYGQGGTGKVIAIITGHAHYDQIGYTTAGIPVIVTTCDKGMPWISSGTDMEPWITQYRIKDTITEQAFDVFVIDRTNQVIKAVRIGCPAMDNDGVLYGDQNFDFTPTLEIREISYQRS